MTSMSALASMLSLTTTTTTGPAYAGGAIFGGLIVLVIAVLISGIALMGIFKKAGEPAWAAFVPLYNFIVLLRIVGLSPWLVILAFIPVVQIVLVVLLAINLAKVFGKGAGTAVLIFFFTVIMYFVLSYGSARYLGRDAARYPLGLAPQQGIPGGYTPGQYQS